MSPGFWFPTPATRIWMSRSLNPQRGVGELTLIGRVSPGTDPAAVQGPLGAIAARLAERFQYPDPNWDKTRAPAATPLREHLLGDVRPGLVATAGAIALLLVIACVNVAALMLGQMGSRATEPSMRAALGAGRSRLVQQLVIEAS